MADIDIEKLNEIKHLYAPGIEPRTEEVQLPLWELLSQPLSLEIVIGLFAVVFLILVVRSLTGVQTRRSVTGGRRWDAFVARTAAEDRHKKALRKLRHERQQSTRVIRRYN